MFDNPVIAIVDDDEAIREALSELLEVSGFSARAYADAEALLGDRVLPTIDVVVTDVRMPRLDGLGLQRRLRACGATVPVIFLTSWSDPVARERALAEGGFAYLAKPVGDEALLSTIRAALTC